MSLKLGVSKMNCPFCNKLVLPEIENRKYTIHFVCPDCLRTIEVHKVKNVFKIKL